MVRSAYPHADELLTTADAGGSNGYRARAWKTELQDLPTNSGSAPAFALPTRHQQSKWNRIEHRLFCHITQN